MPSDSPAGRSCDESTQQAALALLDDHYDLQDCPECGIREEYGLVLGDADCAIGVAVCPNCGYYSRCLTADPAGVATDPPYDHMYRLAMEWVPDWHPGTEDVTGDWRCHCGEQWRSWEAANIHVYQQHPENTRLTHVRHDRYPWSGMEG